MGVLITGPLSHAPAEGLMEVVLVLGPILVARSSRFAPVAHSGQLAE